LSTASTLNLYLNRAGEEQGVNKEERENNRRGKERYRLFQNQKESKKGKTRAGKSRARARWKGLTSPKTLHCKSALTLVKRGIEELERDTRFQRPKGREKKC